MGCSDVAIRYFSSSLAMTCMRGNERLEDATGVRDTKHLVELFVKLIQLRGLRHDILVHHEWGLNFFVSSLAQKVEPVRDECLIEVDAIIREEVATVTGDFGSCKRL